MVKDLFEQFFQEHDGENVEFSDPSNLNQCMDLAFSWCDFIGIPYSSIRHLYAYQVFSEPTTDTKKYFKLISNTSEGIPECGDLVVFGQKVGASGHISIANGIGDLKTFQSFDQNWGTTVKEKKCQIVTHTYTGVLGWLRPILTNLPTALKDTIINWDDEEGNRHEVGWYVRELFGEKEEKEKLAGEVATWRGMYETCQKDGSSLRQDVLLKTKEIYTLSDDKKSIVGQLDNAREELEGLRVKNEELTQKISNLGDTIQKLQTKMTVLENSKEITSKDIFNFIKSKFIGGGKNA